MVCLEYIYQIQPGVSLRFTIAVLSRTCCSSLFSVTWKLGEPSLAWPPTLTEIAYGVEAAKLSAYPAFSLMHQVSCTENDPFLIIQAVVTCYINTSPFDIGHFQLA